jgi:hypothetical protein
MRQRRRGSDIVRTQAAATLARMRSNLPLVACSLDAADQEGRLADWAELLAQTTAREETPDGVRYSFPTNADLKTQVEALAAAEESCCSSLEFNITQVGDQFEMTVTAPPNGRAALRFIFSV